MNLQLSKKNLAFIFTIILAVVLPLGSYFYLVNPLKSEIKTLKEQLSTEEKLYDTLAERVGSTKTSVIGNSRNLQKKLPVESFMEQFVLDLEKAEVVSNSLIEDMTFQNQDVSEKDVIVDNSGENNEASTETSAATDSQDTGQQSTDVPGIPEGIKRVTVNLTVTSKDYFDLLTFLEAIENLERVTKIDSLTFNGGKEILSTDQEIEELTYKVVISTFYYPALKELKDELPVFDTPPPSNKDNPLPTGMYYKEDIAKKTDKAETKQSDKTESKPTEETKSVKKQAVMGGNNTQ
ncbi:MAG TPA: hypothetical protein GX497_06395 [Bacillus bacterium]|nr:hypothetical protein [Bacillus sp. (in: firmicutes)]